jgi:CNT family concentrative nucleoside transporter
LSLKWLLGWVLSPFALVMGVPPGDAVQVGKLLGERAVATEVPAYLHLSDAISAGAISPRGALLTAYALCGFAHVASLAIFVGGTAALVPERRRDLAAVGPRALAAATLACLMTGAVAGTFYHGGMVILKAAPK